MAPIKMLASLDKEGHEYVLGQVSPGHYANIQDYSSGSLKNISIRVAPDNSSASVYEFPNGSYTTIRHPHMKYLPLSSYSKRNLDAVLAPGQSFSHKLETKSHAKGKLTLTYISGKNMS